MSNAVNIRLKLKTKRLVKKNHHRASFASYTFLAADCFGRGS